MEIVVVFTGGTIGSSVREGMIGPKEENQIRLLSLYQKRAKRDVTFETVTPFTRLSENSTGQTLRQLAECVGELLEQAERKKWAGIIIAHGTDTLAYSAAALGYLFADSKIPVVFVSSNYVLEDRRANGLSNFYYAVEFIAGQHVPGVFVSYENQDHMPRIHWGTRVLAHAAYSDEVFSVLDREFGHFEGERFVRREEDSLREARRNANLACPLQPPQGKCSPILQINPYPGMSYPGIPEGVNAILHHTYHAGTICGETPGAEAFFEAAWERQIPVFLTGAVSGNQYESTRIYHKYHIRVLPAASPVSMYIKLWLLLSSGANPTEWMDIDLGGELIQEEENTDEGLSCD